MFRRAQPQSPTVRDVDAEQLSRNELLAHVEELRKHIGVVTRERDRLQRENEDYINNSVSATFDSSSFLRETLLSRETELQQKDAELKHVKAERDELVEDVAMIKEAKRLSDRSCREATSSVTRMQQELQFYQKQAVDAMQARDRANGEAEQMRTRNSKLDTAVSSCQSDLKATQHSYAEAQQRLKDQEQEIADLMKRVEHAAQVPTLQLQVERLQEALASERDTKVEAEAKIDRMKAELEVRGKLVAELQAQICTAQEDQSALQLQIEALKDQVQKASTAKGQGGHSQGSEEATSGPSDTIKRLQGELAEARASIKTLTVQVNEADADKTRLLLENSGLEKQLKARAPVLVEEEDESSWGGWPWRRRASVQSSPSKTADSSPDT